MVQRGRAPEGISADQFKRLRDGGEAYALIDTRDEESFESWRLADAEHYSFKPDGEFDSEEFRAATALDTDDPIVTICAMGQSSKTLAEELADAGFSNVRYVEGGMAAWSAVYDAVEVTTPGPASVVQIQRRAKGCLGYLVADPAAGLAAAVDPTRHVEEFVAAAEERDWTIQRVLDTHVHADHISGGPALAEKLDVPYHLGEGATERDIEYDYTPLERNAVVHIGSVDLKAVATPGHTTGSVSYLVGWEALLTGDTVFVDGVGRTELQFGDADAETGAELLHDSIHGTVLAEPDAVVVCPGHFSVSDRGESDLEPGLPVATTVGDVRTGHPLLQRNREAFVDAVTERVPEKPPNYERVLDINLGRRRSIDEDEAVELELGPNRCAAE